MNKANNYAPATASMTTTMADVATADDNRSALIIGNQSADTDVQLYLDANATAYITLAAGDTMHFPAAPRNLIRGKTASGTATLTVWAA